VPLDPLREDGKEFTSEFSSASFPLKEERQMSQKLSRRQFLIQAGVGLAGLALAACQTGQQAEVGADTTSVPAPEVDTGPLQIMWVSQVALVENFQQYSDNIFTPANNGAKVEFIIVPGDEFL
jgi:hypothetical protein